MPLRFDDLDVTDLAARIRARAFARLPRFREAPDGLAGRPAVDRDELLAVEEPEAFVRACYRTLLRREADPDGLAYYLGLLRSGRATKLEVIGRIRFSAAGRAAGVTVRGLVLPLALNLSYRVPLAGRLLELVTSVATLPALARQLRRFQAAVATRLAERDRHLEALTAAVEEELAALREQVERLEAVAATPALDELEAALLDEFRGPEDDVAAKLAVHIEPVVRAGAGTADAPVLDLACGRGEWLRLLRERGLVARGVERNPLLVERCRAAGLEVERANAVAYLRGVPDGALGAVCAFHLVEHLPFPALVALLQEAARALRPGGLLVLETPNPENPRVAAVEFHLDPTHLAPLPSELLGFLVERSGFADVEVLPLNPDPGPSATGPRDYAVIARR